MLYSNIRLSLLGSFLLASIAQCKPMESVLTGLGVRVSTDQVPNWAELKGDPVAFISPIRTVDGSRSMAISAVYEPNPDYEQDVILDMEYAPFDEDCPKEYEFHESFSHDLGPKAGKLCVRRGKCDERTDSIVELRVVILTIDQKPPGNLIQEGFQIIGAWTLGAMGTHGPRDILLLQKKHHCYNPCARVVLRNYREHESIDYNPWRMNMLRQVVDNCEGGSPRFDRVALQIPRGRNIEHTYNELPDGGIREFFDVVMWRSVELVTEGDFTHELPVPTNNNDNSPVNRHVPVLHKYKLISPWNTVIFDSEHKLDITPPEINVRVDPGTKKLVQGSFSSIKFNSTWEADAVCYNDFGTVMQRTVVSGKLRGILAYGSRRTSTFDLACGKPKIHMIEDCEQCGRSGWCEHHNWFLNEPFLMHTFTVSSTLHEWGCDKLEEPIVIIHDSFEGKVYVVENGPGEMPITRAPTPSEIPSKKIKTYKDMKKACEALWNSGKKDCLSSGCKYKKAKEKRGGKTRPPKCVAKKSFTCASVVSSEMCGSIKGCDFHEKKGCTGTVNLHN